MKKTLFLVVLTLLSMEVFSQEWVYQYLDERNISTSERVYQCRMWFRGRNNGTSVAAEERVRQGYSPLDRLSNGQWDAVDRMLNRYQNSGGDTYNIYLEWHGGGNEFNWRTISIIVEFTSNTQYNWWAFMYN
jgi:hypothetical protein